MCIPRMSPVLFWRWKLLTCISINADKVDELSPSSVHENVLACYGGARADAGFTQGTFCLESGDFPLGLGEKQGPPWVAQSASLPNARI